MSDVLTLVGSSARAAAQSAARSGFCVHTADLFADLDLREIATATPVVDYPKQLGETIRGPQEGGWLYTGALENHPDLIDHWSSLRRLWGNSGEILRRIRNPLLLSQVLSDGGFPAPGVSDRPDGIPTDGSWLVKPRRSAGGAGIQPWRGTEAASAWNKRIDCPADQETRYFQERIAGASHAAIYLAARRRAVLLGVTEQLVAEPGDVGREFRYGGSIGPVQLPEHEVAFGKLGNLLASEFDLSGLFGVDVVVDTQFVWPVEVNPRYTASMELLEKSAGSPLIAWHIEACRSGTLPEHDRIDNCSLLLAGKSILYATKRLTIPIQEDLTTWAERAQEAFDENDTEASIADIPMGGTVIEPGWPIVTVLASGHDRRQVQQRLAAYGKGIQSRLEN